MIVLKITGCILVVLSSSLFGFYYSNKMNFRIANLEEFRKALVLLKSQMQFSAMTLPESMKLISTHTDAALSLFFKYIADRLNEKKGEGIANIWNDALESSLGKTYLSDEDIDYFKSLGNALGSLDIQLQIDSINMTTDYINSKIELLSGENQKNKKMYASLGVLGGILIAVIFI